MEMDEHALDFFQEVVSFEVEVQDRILLELGKAAPKHQLSIGDLKRLVSPQNTTGSGIDNPFFTALNILKANEFINYNEHFAELGKEGFKLFELLSTKEEISKPYTTYIEKQKLRYRKAEELLQNQVENIKQQTELHPLLIKASNSTIEANRISRIINIYVAIFTFISAEYYSYEFLRDFISDLNIHKRQIIVGFLFSLFILGILGYKKINRIQKHGNK